VRKRDLSTLKHLGRTKVSGVMNHLVVGRDCEHQLESREQWRGVGVGPPHALHPDMSDAPVKREVSTEVQDWLRRTRRGAQPPPLLPGAFVNVAKPWPSCVPTTEEATDMLAQGRQVARVLEAVTVQVRGGPACQVQQGLTGMELDLARLHVLPIAALRWRVVAALALKDDWAGEVDRAALDALLDDVDLAIRAQNPVQAVDALTAAYEAERRELIAVVTDLIFHRASKAPNGVRRSRSGPKPVLNARRVQRSYLRTFIAWWHGVG
jgi:hypothetical protein